MHPFKKHRAEDAGKSRAKQILKADGGAASKPEPEVASVKFMMGYDRNAGGPKMRSDMRAAERISDAVPRGRKD